MSDLFPVGSGEFLCEGGDGVLELQDARVSLCEGVPETLKLLRQASELSFCLLQLRLRGRHKQPKGEKLNMEKEEKPNVNMGFIIQLPAGAFFQSPPLFSRQQPF